jgi:hypothetical protein
VAAGLHSMPVALPNVRVWPLTDTARCRSHVRFWGKRGHLLAALADTIYEYTP